MLLNADNKHESNAFWTDELENSRTLLEQIDKAIYALSITLESSEGVTEYTIDTGQTSQTVRRADLPNLHNQRKNLLILIDELERKLGLHGSPSRQIVPGY